MVQKIVPHSQVQSLFSIEYINIIDLAWSAGIIDGEGCIHIRKDKPTEKSRHKSVIYALVLKVSMTDEKTIIRLKNIFKVGHITCQNRKKENPNRKIVYNWTCMSYDAVYVLHLIGFLLVTKKKVCDEAINFMDYGPGRGGHKRMPAELLQKREECYWNVRKLNSGAQKE